MVEIDGLWGHQSLSMSLHPKVNFLIGANGSGKTTVLNLLASVLTSDYEGLMKTPFNRIRCLLSVSEDEDHVIEVAVYKSQEDHSRTSISYVVRDPKRSEFGFTLASPASRYLSLSARQRRANPDMIDDSELSPLNDFVRVKWLTIHRSTLRSRPDDRSTSEPSVDRQLNIISNQLVRYFSKLSSRRDEEVSRFLRQMLESLIYTSGSDADPFFRERNIDLEELRRSIEELIDEFLASTRKRAKDKLKQQLSLAADATSGKVSFTSKELVALASLEPLQKVTSEWKRTQKKQEEIVRPRTEFLETLNSMYVGKRLEINQRNELEVNLGKGGIIPLSELSSGEKQLLILFAEALLQEKAAFIYIADEPELSLHVTWQEQLTGNLVRINPAAQIIFATHSPDVVSEFGERAIQMEALFG